MITCPKCKTASSKVTPFVDISLDIKKSNTIEEALVEYFKVKHVGMLDDEETWYTCGKCEVKVYATCQSFLEILPPVLCLHLQRFDVIGGNATFKIKKPVKLCEILTLMYKNGLKVNYKLRSIINHIGDSPFSGHYTAIGECAESQFFHFDDNVVRKSCIPEVLNSVSYVVMFEMTPSSWSALFNPSNGLSNNVTGLF